MKLGDLVRASKGDRIGIVMEIFGDLDPSNPWIRVRWTHPTNTFEWCHQQGLRLMEASTKQGGPLSPPCYSAENSGSLL